MLEAAERQLAQGATADKLQTTDTERKRLFSFDAARVLVPSQNSLVCDKDGGSLAAEKFRYLGIRLRHLQQKRLFKRLLITSSMPEEGKSTVAANLAYTLAKSHQKVLLLEGDLRRPTFARQFGLGVLPGLSEWLADEVSPVLNICRVDSFDFSIFLAGNPPGDPLTLMQSDKLSTLMNHLSEWFDWIVIDSPPVLPLGDTSVWMRLADAILLVTRPGKTEKRQLQRSLEVLEQPKLLGALVNGSREATSNDHYYYGYGGRHSMTSAPSQAAQ